MAGMIYEYVGGVGGGGGVGPGSTYTGISDITVGGITAGDTFVADNMQSMWDSLLLTYQPPRIVNLTVFPSAGYREIGDDILSCDITATSAQGDNPITLFELSTSRDGVVYTAVVNPVGQTINYPSLVADHGLINSNFTITARVSDGTTNATASRSYLFTYPLYGTTLNITTLTAQPLGALNSTYYQFDMVAEDAVNKQKAEFSSLHQPITGIEVFNTISGNWEWLGGSKANSLTLFNTSAVTHTIQGNIVNYTRYEHNSVMTGSRQLRFYTN